MTRLTTDLERTVYDRQRAASRDDRVLHVAFLRPDALNARERRIAADLERQSVAAVRQVRAEMSERHARLSSSLDRLKEATR